MALQYPSWRRYSVSDSVGDSVSYIVRDIVSDIVRYSVRDSGSDTARVSVSFWVGELWPRSAARRCSVSRRRYSVSDSFGDSVSVSDGDGDSDGASGRVLDNALSR